jgi:vanillate O-demethylase monooxygenase subunit
MNYFRNAWYAAASPDEINEGMVARTFLNEPVVLYRDPGGRPVALTDRCPHRFAPLSKGKLVEGTVQCPYHGLRFDTTGKCVHNYHGPIPKAATVRAYPLIERYGMVWIWMGDPERADEAMLPDFGVFGGKSGWAIVRGYLAVHANYQLVTDNLLDLSHGQFLHPFLTNPDASHRARFRTEKVGNTVWAYNDFPAEPITKMAQLMWRSESKVGDRRAHMRWDAPSNLWLDVGVTECGRSPEEGLCMPAAHLLTPETERSTHYFWMTARNRMIEDEELGRTIQSRYDHAFRYEDEPMIAAIQERMGTTDLDSLNPIYMISDRAAGRARQVLASLIAEEQKDLFARLDRQTALGGARD